MAKRIRLAERIEGGGNYFAKPKSNLEFILSGCKGLDLALGGGWVEGRMINIVGDKSTGKTLLAIEACANFAAKYPDEGLMFYREAESAFDKHYAKALGFPVDRVDFDQPRTVEDVFEDLDRILKKLKQPALYIIDSLDALSDREELKRDIDKGSYGAGKAKKMSELFRRLIQKVESSRMTLMIISQVRDKIGVTFGPKTARTGGHAMDFYASQVVYLYHIGRLKKTIKGQERAIGVRVRAKLDKNKVALPFREAEFDILFGFGIDDAGACLDYLEAAGELGRVGLAPSREEKEKTDWLGKKAEDKEKKKKNAKLTRYRTELSEMSNADYRAELKDLRKAVDDHWWETEKSFLPTRKKYA